MNANTGSRAMSEQKHPKFGDRIRGIYASERNPQRDGYFVRVVRRNGRLNPGTYYECTDGNGNFWQYPAEFTERLPNADHAAMVFDLEHRLANCDADLFKMQQELAEEKLRSQALRAHADELAENLNDAERRLGALQAFARDVMASWPEGDVDGGALQDYAEKHGLIVPQEAIESCGDDCVCAYYGQFPMTCYRKTELLTGQPA